MMTIQISLLFVLVLILSLSQHFATSCQVYPSEYAYQIDSVTRDERAGANCMRYQGGLAVYGSSEKYIYCDGAELRLTDSELGSEQYRSSDYYVWTKSNVANTRQLLYIFTRRVSLANIVLHYYSDSVSDSGLSRLILRAVPDDFDIWDAPLNNYSSVTVADVPPGGEPAGRRKVSINVNFNTMKLLMSKINSIYIFAVSEMEFFTCNPTRVISKNSAEESLIETMTRSINTHSEIPKLSNEANKTTRNGQLESSVIATDVSGTNTAKKGTSTILLVIGIIIAMAIVLFVIAILGIALMLFLRKSAQRKADYDDTYSTLCRESVQQMQPQSLHTSNYLYDQIQLSPSTGQAEFVSTNETANTNNPPPHQNEYGIHPSVDKDKPKSAKRKITASTISSQDEDNSTSEQPTYAVVNKKKKQKTEKESVHCPRQNTAEQNLDVTEQNVVEDVNQPKQTQDGQETVTQIPSHTVESPQELYAAVKKRSKHRPTEDEEKAPPIPPYTVEELYTAVKKKSKTSTKVENYAPPLPPHTVEELYTAVKKKQKVNTAEDEVEAPPIPAHIDEDLYTAVQKKPKANTAKDDDEAPPVP